VTGCRAAPPADDGVVREDLRARVGVREVPLLAALDLFGLLVERGGVLVRGAERVEVGVVSGVGDPAVRASSSASWRERSSSRRSRRPLELLDHVHAVRL
jgi:hypothetical protein